MQSPRDPQPSGRRAVVVIGGDPLDPRAVGHVGRVDVVIAADSGYDRALAAGLQPQVLVGDLDSISPAGRAHAAAAGVDVDLHPSDKDATDTELAVDRALSAIGPGGSLTVLAGGGDRLDHLLGAIAVLARPTVAAFGTVTAWFGPALVHVAHGPRTLRLDPMPPDTTISLLPVGDAHGVSTAGLRWQLAAEPLPLGTSRGVSNLSTGDPVQVTVGRGVVAIVIPAAAALISGPHGRSQFHPRPEDPTT